MGSTDEVNGPHKAAGRGHRTVPHTADRRIEAWGPTREGCIAEVVRGLADSFAVVAGRTPHAGARRHMTTRSDQDPVVAVIDEGLLGERVWTACGPHNLAAILTGPERCNRRSVSLRPGGPGISRAPG